MMGERPDADEQPAEEPREPGDEAEADEAYTSEEEAEVAARLEDLGYI
jgi:hypothetical protein